MDVMGLPVETQRYTVEEYLRMEEKAAERHEFHDGEILAMSGGTYRHSRIIANSIYLLGDRLRTTGCAPLESKMRVRIAGSRTYLYPDISVACGTPQFDEDDRNSTTIINPRVVVEVLSDGTELYDRGRKFDLYRRVPSLEEYVLISQHTSLVQTFFRQNNGGWLFNAWEGKGKAVTLRSLAVSLPLDDIYYNVQPDGPVGS